MNLQPRDASFYDNLRAADGVIELPDDPKPVHEPDVRARARAVREGRLTTPCRDELQPNTGDA